MTLTGFSQTNGQLNVRPIDHLNPRAIWDYGIGKPSFNTSSLQSAWAHQYDLLFMPRKCTLWVRLSDICVGNNKPHHPFTYRAQCIISYTWLNLGYRPLFFGNIWQFVFQYPIPLCHRLLRISGPTNRLSSNHIISGCNIGSKTLLAEQGKLPLKFTCPAGTTICSPTLFD